MPSISTFFSRLWRISALAMCAVAPEVSAQEELAPSYVTVTESGAVVTVDGAIIDGATVGGETFQIDLPLGEHILRVEKEGFQTIVDTLTGGVSEILTYDLESDAPDMVFRPSDGLTTTEKVLIALLVLCAIAALVLALAVARKRQQAAPVFDRYRVLRPIGRGGMATVFLARDAGESIALKVMDQGLLGDADLVRKFLREGEVLQRIAEAVPGSPVVRAFRYGRENNTADGRPFVALEYIPGDTLLKFFRARGTLSLREVLGVTRQVCDGLAAAHAQGVWHRDISPDNVLLEHASGDGHAPTIKLIDFGVAKNEYTQAKTLDGSIAGKPPYMSPEQCSGAPLDGRSDLYSVGIMMYTLITGQPPFTHRNPLLVMRLHETAPVPPLPASVPEPVRALVMRLLSKDPNARPASAADVANQLSALERMN